MFINNSRINFFIIAFGPLTLTQQTSAKLDTAQRTIDKEKSDLYIETMNSSSSEAPTPEETIPSEGQPEGQPSPPVDLGSVSDLAERLSEELAEAQKYPTLSPQELEGKLAERERLLEVQENVFDKLMQMPEIARGRELATLERVRRCQPPSRPKTGICTTNPPFVSLLTTARQSVLAGNQCGW